MIFHSTYSVPLATNNQMTQRLYVQHRSECIQFGSLCPLHRVRQGMRHVTLSSLFPIKRGSSKVQWAVRNDYAGRTPNPRRGPIAAATVPSLTVRAYI